MTRQRLRYATVSACVLGFGAVGFLLARMLRGQPFPAAVTLGLVMVEELLARWKWPQGY